MGSNVSTTSSEDMAQSRLWTGRLFSNPGNLPISFRYDGQPVNGIPELIEHGRTGLLATPGDVDSLTTQLRRLIQEPALRHSLAQAAHTKVLADFDLGRNVAQLSATFSAFVGAAA